MTNIPKSPLYTRTGDKGTTALVGGTRVSKTHARLEAYGTVDELNSQIGLLAACLPDGGEDLLFLRKVQATLFTVGSHLATDQSVMQLRPTAVVTPEMVAEMESEIDRVDSLLPPLRLFILPGGSHSASQAHVCRTVCRRAERRILNLVEEGAVVSEELIAYVNRLSDYFFALARKLNMDEKKDEIIWRKNG